MQGIGFRPFVYRLAQQQGLCGWVSNQADGVHIKVQGGEQAVQEFYQDLSAKAPPLARILSRSLTQIEDEAFKGFQILKTPSEASPRLVLTPDLAMCADCRAEIKDRYNRRYQYAFTTCTSCGPRYAIMASLPYDREHTTMAPFKMCEACAKEYQNPENRRYYSQTNSCPQCPISLALYDAQQGLITSDQQHIIPATVRLLREGKIVAVKGIGGYLLMADATSAQAIAHLRERKHRPSKPFALLYPNLEMALQDVTMCQEEQELLVSPKAPIVLAQIKPNTSCGVQAALLAPNLNRLGIMLPYTPLFELLLAQFQKPLVATSANRNGNHICYREEEAFEQLAGIADYVLVHNREILFPQDDAVMQLSPRHQHKIMLRRSRGYAPSFAGESEIKDHLQPLLALGADMKGTFAFTASGNTYVSQYLGDLANYDNLLNFEHMLEQLTSLAGFQPSLILTDKHPAYASVQFGNRLAQKHAIPWVEVQHHEAHFAAVLAENELLDSTEPVLGVIWDGNGLGHDGLIRGGEFLLLEHAHITSLAQLQPYPHLLGDKMAQEPRIAALTLCHDLKEVGSILKQHFTEREWQLYQRMLQDHKVPLQTTSMGRVFDAAAALLGLCTRNNYEGEAALLLESLASRAHEVYELLGYTLDSFDGRNIPIKGVLRQMAADVQRGISPAQIAARFHVTLVDVIERVAAYHALHTLAFSGGVFQNSLLVDLIMERLSPKNKLHFHRQLPPNDECVSFGQLAWMKLQHKQQVQANSLGSEKQYTLHHP